MTMDDLLDMMIADESSSKISDEIKNILFAKAANRVDSFRPDVSQNMFGQQEEETEE